MNLNVLALADAMEALRLPDSTIDLVAELFGLQDSVTLAELRAPAVDAVALPGRDLPVPVLRLRHALDATVRSVLCIGSRSSGLGHVCVLESRFPSVAVERVSVSSGHTSVF